MLDKNLFQNVLESFRARMGDAWTQERTAQALGISRGTYNKWAKGHSMPTQVQLKRIAAIFHLHAEEEDILYRAAAQVSPQIHNLPSPVNDFFTGREAYLQQLRDLLKEEKPVCVCGLGGMGKTQLVLAYAHQCYPNVYRTVLWVNAAEHATLQAGYDDLTRILALPEQDEQKADKRVEAVKRWLEGHRDWLLIMDNADDLLLARSFLPSVRLGRVVLTTRSQIVRDSGVAAQVQVEEMKPEEGLRFLLQRTGRLKIGATLDDVTTNVRETALQLVELLGGHPLALDQAGAYIEETDKLFDEYITLYQTHRHSLLGRRKQRLSTYADQSEHPQSVVVTFELSFAKARNVHPLAEDILRFCAFLQPDAIPEELLLQEHSFKTDTIAFADGVIALRRYSLVKSNAGEKMYSLHRLVQAVLIDDMPFDLQRIWKERVMRALRTTFPALVDFKGFRQCERLLPHALTCAMWQEDELTPTVEVAEVWHKTGSYLCKQGQYAEAEALLTRALSIYEQQLGPEHPRITPSLQGLAIVYFDQGNFEKTEELGERVHAILAKSLGPEHPFTVLSMLDMAASYVSQGKLSQAELWHRRVTALQEKLLEAEPVNSARLLTILASGYMSQGKPSTAEPLYQQAIELYENNLETEHPDIGDPLFGLGDIYLIQGRRDQAELLYRRALKIWKRYMGAEHPYTARSLHRIAGIKYGQGKYEQAEALYRNALSILEKKFDEGHPYTQMVKKDYAKLLRHMGRNAEAAALEATDEPLE